MTYPLIGKTWDCHPERQTLTEAKKREVGAELRYRSTEAKAAVKSMENVEVPRG